MTRASVIRSDWPTLATTRSFHTMTDPVPPGAVSRQLTTAEREGAVARLSSAFANDAITMEEFERRTTLALRAASAAELAALVADLPAAADAAGLASAGNAVTRTSDVQRMRAVFGNLERGGTMDVPARLEIRAIFGNVELDLSAARFGEGVTEIAVRAVCGNVEMRLPEGAIVENRGSGILASFTSRARKGDAASAGAHVRILVTGRAVLGNVEIETAAPSRRASRAIGTGGEG